MRPRESLNEEKARKGNPKKPILSKRAINRRKES